jgi:hypothetical protein
MHRIRLGKSRRPMAMLGHEPDSLGPDVVKSGMGKCVNGSTEQIPQLWEQKSRFAIHPTHSDFSTRGCHDAAPGIPSYLTIREDHVFK